MRIPVTLALVAAAVGVGGAVSQDTRSIVDVRPPGEEYLFTVHGQVRGTDMVVDANGNAYVTGETTAIDFPTTPGAYDRTCGTDGQCNSTVGPGKYGMPRTRDAFVTKLAPDGTLAYSTYFGGRGEETGAGIAVDALGRVHIIVDSNAINGPGGLPVSANIGAGCGKSLAPTGAYGVPRDVIIVRFNAQGTGIDYATCIGGTGDDFPQGIAIAADGSVYLTGRTDSTDFPLVRSLQPVHRGGRYDIFVARLDATGKQLAFSTYLGGSGPDVGHGLAVDPEGNIHVLGHSSSEDFPLVLPLQREHRGDADIVLVKIDARNRLMLYSTFFGTETFDFATAISTDRSGNVFVVGESNSKNFPVTEGAFGTACAPYRYSWLRDRCSGDAFAWSVDAFGRLRYSTYLGGNALDVALDVAVDDEGRALVVGETQSPDFPNLWPPLSIEPGDRVAYLARIGQFGSVLLDVRVVPSMLPYGAHSESVGLDHRGDVYVMGANKGSGGLFVAKVATRSR